MPFHADMLTLPRVPAPALTVMETHEQFEKGHGIIAAEIAAALERIGYETRPRDIRPDPHRGRCLRPRGAPPCVMWDQEYRHLENLMNLEQIGRPFRFQLSVLPIRRVGTTGAPVRAVAIVED